MDRKNSKNASNAFVHILILCCFFFQFMSCQSEEIFISNNREKNIIDTLYLKGRIVHSMHVNANSGVIVVKLDTSNVLIYKGIYDDQDDLDFGLISHDTAYIMTEGFDRIIPNRYIVFKQGWWIFNENSDSLEFWRVNNIVGTIDKSKRFISNYRGDGIFKNHFFLGQLIFLVWTPIIMFILFAIAFKIMKVRI